MYQNKEVTLRLSYFIFHVFVTIVLEDKYVDINNELNDGLTPLNDGLSPTLQDVSFNELLPFI